MAILKAFQFLFIVLATVPAMASTVSDYVHSIHSDPNALYAFFKDMPKGGELHYHLDGGAYPETMLDLAAHHKFCIQPNTYAIKPYINTCDGITALDISKQQALYRQTIRAWSMDGFVPGQESSHDHFHATFSKISGLESNFRKELLAEIMQRAADQHELYMEIYLSADSRRASTFDALIKNETTLADKQRVLLANPDFQKNIQDTILESHNVLQQARDLLQCNSNNPQPACDVTIKFQYYVFRQLSEDAVFAAALTGFMTALQSPDVIGVNIVGIEDSLVGLADYHKHMQLFEFLHKAYPLVHIALHAGEMSPDAVRPKDLRFHIRDAIDTGHAERIGHGVSIAYEEDVESLLHKMQTTPIPVEINLTSNRVVLNITGAQHPLRFYLSHHVPVVLSTDDEGILRTDLTRQYVDAVINHHLDYPTLRLINRNVLTYSFLPGKSLWEHAPLQTRVQACIDLNSESCKQFIQKNPKASLQWQLESQLLVFEKRFKR